MSQSPASSCTLSHCEACLSKKINRGYNNPRVIVGKAKNTNKEDKKSVTKVTRSLPESLMALVPKELPPTKMEQLQLQLHQQLQEHQQRKDEPNASSASSIKGNQKKDDEQNASFAAPVKLEEIHDLMLISSLSFTAEDLSQTILVTNEKAQASILGGMSSTYEEKIRKNMVSWPAGFNLVHRAFCYLNGDKQTLISVTNQENLGFLAVLSSVTHYVQGMMKDDELRYLPFKRSF